MNNKNSDILLRMENIDKKFPGVKALDGVSLTVKKGTVHALMGENGAGKSTLMKCLFGVYTKDSGKIFLEGREVSFRNSKEALENGVAMVHQELNQALKRNVMENMWLGRFPTVSDFLPFTSEKKMYDETKKLLSELRINVDPKTVMAKMPVSQRQMVEIAKAVSYDSKIIVFDEPTAMLDPRGRKDVMNIITKLNKEMGKTVVLITHYMDEAAKADRVVVIDSGKIIADGKPSDVFNEVELLKSVGLDVPQPTELIYKLKKAGVAFSEKVLHSDECIEAISKALED